MTADHLAWVLCMVYVGLAVWYGIEGNWRKLAYWLAVAVIVAVVTEKG